MDLIAHLSAYRAESESASPTPDGEGAQGGVGGVEALYALLAAAGARVPPDDAVALDDLRAAVGAAGDEARRAGAWADARRPWVAAAVDARLAAVRAALRGAGAEPGGGGGSSCSGSGSAGSARASGGSGGSGGGGSGGGAPFLAPLRVYADDELQRAVPLSPDLGGGEATVGDLLGEADELAGWAAELAAAAAGGGGGGRAGGGGVREPRGRWGSIRGGATPPAAAEW